MSATSRALARGYARGHRGQRLVDFVMGRLRKPREGTRRLVEDSARELERIMRNVNQPREGEE